MKRPLFIATFFVAATAVLAAQEASQSSPYQGVSNPPQDDIITTETPQPTQAKPPAGHPMNAEPAAPAQPMIAAPPPAVTPPMQDRNMNIGTDDGIVQPQAMPRDTRPSLADQAYVPGPDDGIVHLAPLGPGELREGTIIRVRLENDLSSAWTDEGQSFKSRVASDVVEGGQVVIPAGAEISGKVVDVSTGHFGGHGTLMLHPDTVTMPSGESFQLHAMVESAPGTHTRVDAEGVICRTRKGRTTALNMAG